MNRIDTPNKVVSSTKAMGEVIRNWDMNTRKKDTIKLR
jgi:hypothetical protein